MGTIISSAPLLKSKTFANVTDFTDVTGVTTQNITGSILIPANSVVISDVSQNVMEITARTIKSGSNGTLTTALFVNSTPDISGATLIAAVGSNAGSFYAQLQRTAFIDKGGTKIMNSGVNAISDVTTSTGSEQVLLVNWTVDQYIILAVQNASASDLAVGSGLIAKIYN